MQSQAETQENIEDAVVQLENPESVQPDNQIPHQVQLQDTPRMSKREHSTDSQKSSRKKKVKLLQQLKTRILCVTSTIFMEN